MWQCRGLYVEACAPASIKVLSVNVHGECSNVMMYVIVQVYEVCNGVSVSRAMLGWFIIIQLNIVTLVPGDECEGNACGHVCLSACLSVRTSNSKTIPPIDLIIFLHKTYYVRGPVLLQDDPGPE